MKRAITTYSRFGRLCLSAMGLLFAQHVLAIGTPAGDPVSNQATVSYSVNSVGQPDITSNTATFLVDQRVDFTLIEQGGAPTTVTVGTSDAVTTFQLTNTGNAPQDFDLSAINLNGGTVNGLADSGTGAGFDVEDPPRVFADTDGSGDFSAGDDVFVDELSEVAGSNSILVFIVANIPGDLPDGTGANVELTATAHDAGAAGLGALTAEDDGVADDPNAVQVVFANGSTGQASAAETAQDGYDIESASVTAAKSSSVIADGFSASDPKAIPGATIEYEVEVTNGGSQSATGIGIVDPLDGNVTIALGEYAGGDAEISQGGAVIFSCTLDVDDATTTDGCGIFTGVGGPEVRMAPTGGSAVTLQDSGNAPNNVAVFRFRVTIN